MTNTTFNPQDFEIGRKFGRWTVIGGTYLRPKAKQRDRYVPCRCECGVVRDVKCSVLLHGRSVACGCRRTEAGLKRAKHGDAAIIGGRARLHNTWTAMKQRCLNPNCEKYPEYGGRGITVCAEWMEYIPFRSWALANGYADDLQIDRIDNDKGYYPDNCRFVSRPQNQRNRRVCKMFEAFGETKNLEDWLKDPRCVVTDPSLRKRLKRGMSFEEALTRPKEASNGQKSRKST